MPIFTVWAVFQTGGVQEAPCVLFGGGEAADLWLGVLSCAGAWSFSCLNQDQSQRQLCETL